MRQVAVRALLALYPQGVRARYGDEIGELLAQSRTPWRDAADTARSALTERLATITRAGLRRTGRSLLLGLLVIVAAPTALFVVTLFTGIFLPPAGIVVAALAGALVGSRTGRRSWWLPATIVAGSAVLVATIPRQLLSLVVPPPPRSRRSRCGQSAPSRSFGWSRPSPGAAMIVSCRAGVGWPRQPASP
jgi:hypothetical protein